jgi:hypothetical protein
MFPSLTNIDRSIYLNLQNKKRQNNQASKLNTFVRVFSGAVVNGQNGLIITSNNDLQMFEAAGESIYGNERMTGVLGRTFDGKLVLGGADRGLRPSPVVVGFNVKEGKDQISREATLTINCFSLEQLEMMQDYFLQPGYSLAVEFGWNTDAAGTSLIPTTTSEGKSIGATSIVNNIAKRNLDYNDLHNWRVNSHGDWDCFLGFIVGGSISNEGETYVMEVKLRGAPGLPTFLQSHKQITQIDKATGKVTDTQSDTSKYGPAELGKDETVAEKRRFKKMFNSLPAQKILKIVKNIIDDSTFKIVKEDFINMDEVVDEALKITEWKYATTNTIPETSFKKDKLKSEQKYISMRLAMEILNRNGSLDAYKIGDKQVNVKIDIQNARIGAFPYMYSTNKSALAIAGVIPNFGALFFGGASYEFRADGTIITTNPDKTTQEYKPIYRAVNGTTVEFVQYDDIKKDLSKGILFNENGGYWGFLKNLYVNFDMFCEKITQPNKNIREVLLDILNEMTGAVNSFWFFQIVEDDSDVKNGNVKLTVIDENWVGNLGDGDTQIARFKHSGTNSPFLEANLDLSLTGELVNYLVCRRLQLATNPDERYTNVSDASFFKKTRDLFVSGVVINGQDKIYAESGKDAAGNDIKDDKDKDKENAVATTIDGVDYSNVTVVEEDQTKNRDIASIFVKKYMYDGKVIATVQTIVDGAGGTKIITSDDKIVANYDKIQNDIKQKQNSNATVYLEKIDIVSDPMVDVTEPVIGATEDIGNFNYYYRVYCYDDTSYLDVLKQNAFSDKSGLSHPLPIKYTFKVLGTSGLRRGDMFVIDGIPKQYTDNGIFQITNVEHTLGAMNWYTSVTGDYRVSQGSTKTATIKPKTAEEINADFINVLKTSSVTGYPFLQSNNLFTNQFQSFQPGGQIFTNPK